MDIFRNVRDVFRIGDDSILFYIFFSFSFFSFFLNRSLFGVIYFVRVLFFVGGWGLGGGGGGGWGRCVLIVPKVGCAYDIFIM